MLSLDTIDELNEFSFKMIFADKRNKRMTTALSKELEKYKTPDTSECHVRFTTNTSAKLVVIHITIKYPKNSITNQNDLEELKGLNVEWFEEFYNNLMGY